ncbi:MAG: methionine--tRNA ligase subunit beta, partial [Clostridia bacterium]|nr:methionine--tRNA ligase subunit beta [Clostridia bacterium]
TYENIIARFNGDLANTLGNLVNRTVAMVHKYFGGVVPAKFSGEFDDDLIKTALLCASNVTEKMNEFKTADALEEIMLLARRSNKYIDETTPWALAKDESQKARLGGVLYNLLESIRFLGVLLTPFMPDTAESIFAQINTKETDWESLAQFGAMATGDGIGEGKPLFNRINEAKKMEEIEAFLDKQAAPAKEQPAEPEVPEISIDDFAKVQLKVGLVLESKRVEGADKLLVSKIKIGDEVRQIVSGIASFRSPEEFVGKKVAVVTNLKPVKLRGVLSEGMILAAGGRKKNEPFALLAPDADIPDGTEIG